MIFKMRSIGLCIFIISSVIAIDEKTLKLYKKMCDFYMRNPTHIADMVKEYRKQFTNYDCEHSIGFHMNEKFCNNYRIRSFSAFLSDQDNYLYVYIRPKIEEKSGSESALFVNFNSLKYNQFEDFLQIQNSVFVLWIKEKNTFNSNNKPSTHSYTIDYISDTSHKTFTTEKFSIRTDIQIILSDWSNGNLTLSFDENSNLLKEISIKDSYFIFCAKRSGKRSYDSKICKPFERNERMSCQCQKVPQDYSWAYLIILFGLFFIASLKPIMDYFNDFRDKKDKTVYYQAHNCSEKSSKYSYQMTIRLSKYSTDFDLSDVNIDIEFFTHNNESVAPNFRFSARVLDTKPIVDVTIYMFRITKMPELIQVQCNHSGRNDRKLCLLGIKKKGMTGDIHDIEWYKILKSIYRNQRYFNLKKHSPRQEITDAEEKPLKNMTCNQISLKVLDLIFIFFVSTSFMLFVSTKIQLKSIESTSLRVFASVIITTTLGIVFNLIFVLLHKFILLSETKQRLRMDSSNERMCLIFIWIYYCVFLFVAFGFAFYSANERIKDSFLDVIRWSSIVFVSSALMALFWNLWSHSEVICISKKRESESMTLTVNSASVNE